MSPLAFALLSTAISTTIGYFLMLWGVRFVERRRADKERRNA
jgi:hypothetical protein